MVVYSRHVLISKLKNDLPENLIFNYNSPSLCTSKD